MTQRITNARLQMVVDRINDALGIEQPGAYIGRDENGKLIANAGHVYIAGAYGGTRLEQMCEGGGCRDFLASGYATKSNVYDQAQAWLLGFRAGQGK